MKKNENKRKPETVGTVTHKYNLKDKKDIAIFIAIIIVAILGIVLISNIVSTRKSLAKIIDNAKEETEKALISNGLAVYTKDVEQNGIQPISNESLPKNTTENQQDIGTIVAPKENWNIETVTAISVGNGDTVPVPIGFYYVGGDLNTGVIISDNKEDQYDGTTDKTTWEYTTSLKGNQFVWIPCTEGEYIKSEVWNGTTQKPGTLVGSGWDKTTYTSELPQIRKYGGFYVARYEAGLAETIPEFTSTQHTESNQVYNKEGKPQARAGVIPWNFIDWTTSQNNAKNMYNTNSVSSGLITGTQWDVILKKLVEKTDLEENALTNSGSWGNFVNNSIKYKGRKARGYQSSSNWYLEAFGEKTVEEGQYTTSGGRELLTTGASSQTEKYHIYDIAGNLYEFTEEASLKKEGNANENNIQHHVFRGGTYMWTPTDSSACYRDGNSRSDYTAMNVGFRVVLYIK